MPSTLPSPLSRLQRRASAAEAAVAASKEAASAAVVAAAELRGKLDAEWKRASTLKAENEALQRQLELLREVGAASQEKHATPCCLTPKNRGPRVSHTPSALCPTIHRSDPPHAPRAGGKRGPRSPGGRSQRPPRAPLGCRAPGVVSPPPSLLPPMGRVLGVCVLL